MTAVPGLVRVWLGRAPERERAADRDVLGAAEQERARRIADRTARARYVGARAGIRRALGGELGVTPEALEWGNHRCPGCGSADHGPPSLVWPRFTGELSVSRTGPWWLLAVAEAGPVGVDLEWVPDAEVGPALGRRCFSQAEREWLAGLPAESQRPALVRGWVRKEAVTKGWGLGVAAELHRVEVLAGRWPAGAARGVVPAPDGTAWSVQDLPVPEGLLAALARPAAAVPDGELVTVTRTPWSGDGDGDGDPDIVNSVTRTHRGPVTVTRTP